MYNSIGIIFWYKTNGTCCKHTFIPVVNDRTKTKSQKHEELLFLDDASNGYPILCFDIDFLPCFFFLYVSRFVNSYANKEFDRI